MTIIYFSATGNSLYIGKRIGGKLLSVKQLEKNGVYEIEDDVIGVITPTYCADVPRYVQNWLSKAKLKANYVFFISTYGYLAGEAPLHAQKYLQQAAGHVDYVDKIIMVDTALTRFETAKQIEKLPSKNVEQQIDKIIENINSRISYIPNTNLFDKAVDKLYHVAGEGQVSPLKAQKSHFVNDSCVRCGVCAKVCPADNIVVKDKVEFLDKCEGCLACVHNCPKNAMHVKGERSNARFRNDKVTLAELVEANK